MITIREIERAISLPPLYSAIYSGDKCGCVDMSVQYRMRVANLKQEGRQTEL